MIYLDISFISIEYMRSTHFTLLCLCVLCFIYPSYSSLYIHDFDYDVFYVGVENTIRVTLVDYPFDQDRDPLVSIMMSVNNVKTTLCTLDTVYKDSNVIKVTCRFPFDSQNLSQGSSMISYVGLITQSGRACTTNEYKKGKQTTPELEGYAIIPSRLVIKKGLKFLFQLNINAIIDISRLEAKLGEKDLQIHAYNSGAFSLELLDDDFSNGHNLYIDIYDKDDQHRRFLRNGSLRTVAEVFPSTDAYLLGFTSFLLFLDVETFRVNGKIAGNPTAAQLYTNDDKFVGTVEIIEATPDYIVLQNNELLRDPSSAYLRLEGHEGSLDTRLLPRDVYSRTLQPDVCEAGSSCILSMYPGIVIREPLTLTAQGMDGSVMTLKYDDISTNSAYDVQYIRDFPSNFKSILTFSVDNITRYVTSTYVRSIPVEEVVLTHMTPITITVQVLQPLPQIYIYGAGIEKLPAMLDFAFLPRTGTKKVVLKMTKGRDSFGLRAYTRVLTDEDCLQAYACYSALQQIGPVNVVSTVYNASITFVPTSTPTLELHRIYFEIYIRHPTVDTLLEMMKDMSMFTLECMNAQFSQFKTVNSIGGTWVDVSVTNSNERCIIALTQGFYDTQSKLYKLLSLTGRSSGAHSQVECDELTPIIFRRDCDIPDKDYFIPVPPASNPVDNSSPKVNKHNYTIIFISLFIGIVGATAAGWYFCKYRKDKLKKNTRDVYNRM